MCDNSEDQSASGRGAGMISSNSIVREADALQPLIGLKITGDDEMDFHGKRKRFVSALLTAAMLFSLPAAARRHELTYASTAQEIKEKAEEDLQKANQNIDKIENKQEKVRNDLSDAGEKLESLLSKQKKLQSKISKTQDQVDQANEDLKAAQKKSDDEYDSMKLRIQFMYENSADNSIWSAILESSGITDMLNRIEYIADMYKSDRKLLSQYQNTVQKVTTLTENLTEKMEGLLELQADYEEQQGEVETLIASLQDKKEQYAEQLAAAEEQAAEFQATIEKQAKIIQRQEAEAARRAAEEEQRRLAAAEAARKAEQERKEAQAEAARQAQQAQVASNTNSSTAGNSAAPASNSENTSSAETSQNTAPISNSNEAEPVSTNNDTEDNSSVSTGENSESAEDYEGGGGGSSGLGDDSSLTDSDNDPEYTSGISGEELVEYALQFVGNPYKWGGNSLTNGCDCSGFVHLVYAHFGYSLPRYSQSFKTVGKAVSYDNIKAGDIVVYPGHVAICIGNGCIVEAQSTRAGITCNRSVDSHTITAIRRVL